MAKSGYSRKSKNLHEMLKGFRKMPNAMAFAANRELTTYELEGHPINVVTGALKGSWGVVSRRDAAILKQVSAAAPYAPRVMGPVSIARAGKPALELLMDRMTPRFERAIVAEFRNIQQAINAGGNYKFDAAAFEAMI